jgi:hypothetical protein
MERTWTGNVTFNREVGEKVCALSATLYPSDGFVACLPIPLQQVRQESKSSDFGRKWMYKDIMIDEH